MTNELTSTQIATQVEELVRVHVESEDLLSPDVDLIYDLAMDSLELVELGLLLEKQFEIKLAIADIRRCTTLGDIIQLVTHNVEGKKQLSAHD
jgi:acyl carrier protein